AHQITHVADDAGELIDAPDLGICFPSGRIHRDAVFVQATVDELRGAFLGQANGIRVEQYHGNSGLEISHNLKDLLIDERLANARQPHPFKPWPLFDKPLDFRQGEVLRRFERVEGAQTRLAFRITAVRGFEVERAREGRDNRRTLWRVHGKPPNRLRYSLARQTDRN